MRYGTKLSRCPWHSVGYCGCGGKYVRRCYVYVCRCRRLCLGRGGAAANAAAEKTGLPFCTIGADINNGYNK